MECPSCINYRKIRTCGAIILAVLAGGVGVEGWGLEPIQCQRQQKSVLFFLFSCSMPPSFPGAADVDKQSPNFYTFKDLRHRFHRINSVMELFLRSSYL